MGQALAQHCGERGAGGKKRLQSMDNGAPSSNHSCHCVMHSKFQIAFACMPVCQCHANSLHSMPACKAVFPGLQLHTAHTLPPMQHIHIVSTPQQSCSASNSDVLVCGCSLWLLRNGVPWLRLTFGRRSAPRWHHCCMTWRPITRYDAVPLLCTTTRCRSWCI